MDEEAFNAQIDTNFFGVVIVTRAVLPVMRQQRSGHIIQISSVGGRLGTPGLSAYQSAKWAVGGFSEVLNQEVRHLNIKVSVLEPGGMRTDWAATARGRGTEIHPDYAPSVGALLELLTPYIGHESGDPAKVAQVVLDIASHENPPLHLLLGSDAVYMSGAVEAARAESAEAWRAVSLSTDFADAAPLPAFPK